MQSRAQLLRHRRVRDVADQHVVEAEAVVAGEERAVGAHELLAREREQRAADAGSGVASSSSATAPRWNSRPSTEPRWTTARSSGSSRSMRAARSAWIVGGTVSAVRVVGEVREELLDEERVALGGGDDALAELRRELVRERVDELVRVVVVERLEHDERRVRRAAPPRTAARRRGPAARCRGRGSARRSTRRRRTRSGRAAPGRPSGCRRRRRRAAASRRASRRAGGTPRRSRRASRRLARRRPRRGRAARRRPRARRPRARCARCRPTSRTTSASGR